MYCCIRGGGGRGVLKNVFEIGDQPPEFGPESSKNTIV